VTATGVQIAGSIRQFKRPGGNSSAAKGRCGGARRNPADRRFSG